MTGMNVIKIDKFEVYLKFSNWISLMSRTKFVLFDVLYIE